MLRRFLVFTAFLVILSVPTPVYGWIAAPSYGNDATGDIYLGMGLAYAAGVDMTPDKSDQAWLLNLRIGYHFVDWFSLQFDFDEFDVDMETYIVTARLWNRFYSTRPYICVGFGLIDAGGSERDPCAKVALGMEYFPYEYISFGGDLAYVKGYNDLDYIEYITFAAGVSLYF